MGSLILKNFLKRLHGIIYTLSNCGSYAPTHKTYQEQYAEQVETRYDSIQFIPYKDIAPRLPDGTLNLYTGFAIKPKNHEIKYHRITFLMRHFTGGIEKHFKWLCDWVAFNFQFPQKKWV